MGEDDYQNLIMYFKCLKKKNYLNYNLNKKIKVEILFTNCYVLLFFIETESEQFIENSYIKNISEIEKFTKDSKKLLVISLNEIGFCLHFCDNSKYKYEDTYNFLKYIKNKSLIYYTVNILTNIKFNIKNKKINIDYYEDNIIYIKLNHFDNIITSFPFKNFTEVKIDLQIYISPLVNDCIWFSSDKRLDWYFIFNPKSYFKNLEFIKFDYFTENQSKITIVPKRKLKEKIDHIFECADIKNINQLNKWISKINY